MVIVQAVFVQDTEIELRVGIALFGGLKQQFVQATAAGSVLPMLPVRLGLRKVTPHFLAPWSVSRLPRLENRRLGFEPLC